MNHMHFRPIKIYYSDLRIRDPFFLFKPIKSFYNIGFCQFIQPKTITKCIRQICLPDDKTNMYYYAEPHYSHEATSTQL